MKTIPSIIALTVLAGCVSYESKPVNWDAEVASLDESPTSVDYTGAELAVRAVAFAPELNAMRLARATSEAKAKASGYWEDPALNADVLRILSEPQHPMTWGGSIAFTLPLSGVPGLERRAAEAYAEADRWEIVAAESAVAIEAETLANTAAELAFAIEDIAGLRASKEYRDARELCVRLVESGEMSRIEVVALNRRERELDRTLIELGGELRSTESRVRRLAGLSPDCKFLRHRGKSAADTDCAEFGPLDFIRAPAVRAALARQKSLELELEKEIRRQYPELSVGPAYTREDGFDKLGFTIGLTLPLWNRNRLGIAGAKGARDEGRAAAINAWKNVIFDYAEVRRELTSLPSVEETSDDEDAKRLYAAGELSAGEFVNAVLDGCDARVGAMRARNVRLAAEVKLRGIVRTLEVGGTDNDR